MNNTHRSRIHEVERLQAMDLVDRWKKLPQHRKAVTPLISERVCKHSKREVAPCKPCTG
jgi:hypothetical protein